MPVNIFFCYAPQDRILLEELEKQLTYLQRQGIINIWHDLKISGGSKREQEINTHFSTAQIILLLVSPDFMRSDHCYTETIQALERQEAGEARVVPVILRNVTWENAPFAKLQALPADKRPIKSWQPKARQDKAFQEVAEGISKVVGEITSKDMQTTSLNTNLKPSISERKNTRERWLKEAANHEKIHNWTEALVAYEQLLLLDPENARIYYKKGSILSDLKRYEEALVAFKQVIQLDSKVTIVYQKIGDILKALRRYEEALVAYEHFIHYSPGDDDSFASEEAEACISKADMLYNMKRYEEALVAYNEAIEFYPDPLYFCFKADMLYNMKRYEEALVAYDRAIKGDVPFAYEGKADVLYNMERYEEAIAAYDEIISYHQGFGDPMSIYTSKGNILCKLHRYEEALVAYDNAVSVDKRYHEKTYKEGDVHTTGTVNNNYANDLVALYKNRGDVLQQLGRPEEAQQSYTIADSFRPNIS